MGKLASKPLLAWVAVAMVAVGCDPSTAVAGRPITNGTAAVDPAVVAIVDPGGAAWCTGTLITPRVVVTAAHCGIRPDNYWDYRVTFGEAVATGTAIAIADAVVHPDFDFPTLAHDLGLLFLAEDPPASPVAVRSTPVSAAAVGQPLRVVGFGDTAPGAGDAGEKREGIAVITAVTATEIEIAPDPSQPCSHDSGGPGLVDEGEGETLVGVVSRGDDTCVDHAIFIRIDVERAGFITPYLEATGPGTAAVGEPCFYPEQCTSGDCVAAVDEPRVRYCSAACQDDDCPAGMSCDDQQCRYPAPTPGALGWPCVDTTECFDGECIADLDQAKVCGRRCVLGRDGDCPAGFDCTFLGGVDFYCLQPEPDPSCCAVAPGRRRGPAPLSGWLALLALALVARRWR